MEAMLEQDRRAPGVAPFGGRLSIAWMVILVLGFVLQEVIIVHFGKPYDAYLGLSGYGMKSGHLWELLTCQLLHDGLPYLLVSLVGFWFFGRALERALGRGPFVRLWLGASLAGAVLQGAVAVAGFLLPESIESVAAWVRERFGGPVMGSSISVCAMFAALCQRRPERELCRWGGVSVRAAHALWLALGVAVVLVALPTNPNLPHLAHLGAMVAAIVGVRRTNQSVSQ